MSGRAETVRQGIDALRAILEQTQSMAQAGVSVDLAGLDERVEQLCAGARALPATDARTLVSDLEALAASLDAVRQALAHYRDTLLAAADGRPDPHTTRQRAAAAYARSPIAGPIEVPIDPPADTDENR